MLFYPTLFLLFLYFKIARIHKKEEKSTLMMNLQHILVFLSALTLFGYGFTHQNWYIVILVSFVFFIISALLITAVQLGIFIDGKPQFGISKIYIFLPALTLSIVSLSAILWL